MKDRILLGPNVGAISIARYGLTEGEHVTVSGFGSLTVGEKPPTTQLHQVVLPIVGLQKCFAAYKNYSGQAKLTDNMFCAGFLGSGGRDACQGDSGG